MMGALPQLSSVLLLLTFIFLVFGILGVQLFAGKQENRCRATPWPVTWDYAAFEEANGPQAALDAVLAGDFRCRDADNFAALPGAGWFAVTSPKDQSAWREPAACYWPLASGPCTMTCRGCARSTSPTATMTTRVKGDGGPAGARRTPSPRRGQRVVVRRVDRRARQLAVPRGASASSRPLHMPGAGGRALDAKKMEFDTYSGTSTLG